MAPKQKNKAFAKLLQSAALLQQKVPNAVLVGGTAASLYADHRISLDHDHVIADLGSRFDAILSALEADPEFVINQFEPGKIILGEHIGIRYGIRQLIRNRPLEVIRETLPTGEALLVPTHAEILRIKSYLTIKRNFTRDYVDVAALAVALGISESGEVLSDLDLYYSDPDQAFGSVKTQLISMLIEPNPKDSAATKKLEKYKELDERWHSWSDVCEVLMSVALKIK